MLQNGKFGKSRIADFAIIFVVSVLCYEGYTKSHFFSYTRDSVSVPLVFLGGCIAALYPFRPHNRILWLITVPFGVTILPLIGYNVHMRLTAAPGHEMPSSVATLLPTVLLFLIATIIWLPPAFFGWRLRCETADEDASRTMGLKELFAITGIMCVLLVLFRDSFAVGAESQSRPMYTALAVMSFFNQPENWLFLILVGAGLFFDWRLAVGIALVSFVASSMLEWHLDHLANVNATRRLQLSGIIGTPISTASTPYVSIAFRHAWQLTVLVIAIVMGRLAGYRIRRRRPQLGESPENTVPTSS